MIRSKWQIVIPSLQAKKGQTFRAFIAFATQIGQKNLSRPPVRELPRLPRLCTVQGGQGSCACHQRTKPGDDDQDNEHDNGDHDNEHDDDIKAGSWDRMVGMIKINIVLESRSRKW